MLAKKQTYILKNMHYVCAILMLATASFTMPKQSSFWRAVGNEVGSHARFALGSAKIACLIYGAGTVIKDRSWIDTLPNACLCVAGGLLLGYSAQYDFQEGMKKTCSDCRKNL